MKLGDGLSGLICVIAGLLIMLGASAFPATHGQAYGPDLFPDIIAIGFIGSGLLLLAGGWRMAGHGFSGSLEASGEGGRPLDAFMVIFAVILFMLLTQPLGFLLAGGLILAGMIAWFRRGHALSAVLIAITTVLLIDVTFRAWLLVPLPLGPLDFLPW